MCHVPIPPPRSWIAVASAGHVAIGRAHGFCQVNHGKSAPLLPRLSFAAGKTNWGAPFRYGLFQIPDTDREIIAPAMDLPSQA